MIGQKFNMQQSKIKSFTLIEFFTVTAIVGIIILIGAPLIRNYQPSLQLNGAVRDLVSDIRYVQQLAVTEQVEHSVYFISSEKRYQIKRYGTETSTLKEIFLPEEITEISISGLSEVEINKEARYNPYGAVKDFGSVTLKNSKNATSTIDIRPSGFVKIID